MIKGKKGTLIESFSIIAVVITIFIVPFIAYTLIANEAEAIKSEVKEADQVILDEYLLNNYLRTKVDDKDIADLINLMHVDKKNKDDHKKELEDITEEIFNTAIGEDNWQIRITLKEESLFETDTIKGETSSHKAMIPTTDNKRIDIILVVGK